MSNTVKNGYLGTSKDSSEIERGGKSNDIAIAIVTANANVTIIITIVMIIIRHIYER